MKDHVLLGPWLALASSFSSLLLAAVPNVRTQFETDRELGAWLGSLLETDRVTEPRSMSAYLSRYMASLETFPSPSPSSPLSRFIRPSDTDCGLHF